MKPLFKYLIYVLILVMLVIGSIMLYRTHPEAQLAFTIPGLFILAYSKLTDDIKIKHPGMLRGR
jgi:cytochrome b561